MLYIEASRRVSRAAVSRIRDAFTEYDRVVFKDVDLEDTYEIVRDGRTYVLAINDPTLIPEQEEYLHDCGD